MKRCYCNVQFIHPPYCKKVTVFLDVNISGCNIGYYYNSGCIVCPIGSYMANGSKNGRCTHCPDGMGTHKDLFNENGCISCPPGNSPYI